MITTNGLAIDSAVNPACAWFGHGELVHAEFTQRPNGRGLDWVVAEALHYRGAADNKKMPNLLKMHTGGMLAAGYAAGQSGAEIILRTPKEWKGEEPKPVQHGRLWLDVLTIPETNLLTTLAGGGVGEIIERAIERGALDRWGRAGGDYYPSRWTFHNILDAVALGCFHLGRLEKR